MAEVTEGLKFGYGYHGLEVASLSEVKYQIHGAPELRYFEYFCDMCELETNPDAPREVFATTLPADHSQNCPAHCVMDLANSCPKLDSLALQCQAIDLKTIETLVSRCSMLSSLRLYKVGGNHSEYFPLANLKHLKDLELDQCAWADDDFFAVMTGSEAKLAHLAVHKLENASENAVCSLVKVMHETLVSLSLGQNNLTAFTHFTICHCPIIQSLWFSDASSIDIASMRKLAFLPNLRRVYMRRLESMETLLTEHLILLGGLRHITEAHFVDCPSLHDFDVLCLSQEALFLSVLHIDSCCNVTGFSLKCIVVCGKRLRAIHLTNIDLRDPTFLDKLSQRRPTLRLLTVYNCIFESRVTFLMKVLEERRENLKIYTDDDIESKFDLNVFPYLPATQQRRLAVRYDLFDYEFWGRVPPNIPYGYRVLTV